VPEGFVKKAWLCEGLAMSKSDEYRVHAQECERMAAISRNPEEKTALLLMAQQWLRMIPNTPG